MSAPYNAQWPAVQRLLSADSHSELSSPQMLDNTRAQKFDQGHS